VIPDEAVKLGFGVRLVPLIEGSLQVRSAKLELPWVARAGRAPGSAVIWEGNPFEVVGVTRLKSNHVWNLHPWPDQEAMRHVVVLDRRWLEILSWQQRDARMKAQRWWILLALTPILGLAPARLQLRWQSEWGFAAGMGTGISALVEIAAGALGVVQVLASGFGVGWFLPGHLRWLAVCGPVLLVVGLVRLVSILVQGKPMGSVFGLPFLILQRSKRISSTRSPDLRRPNGEADRTPNPIRTAWITALACLAPRELQEEWAPRIGIRPLWLTVIGGGSEALGGIVNLRATSSGELFPWFIVDVFVLLEGLARLALLIATRAPVGSLLGIPLRSWLARAIRDTPHPPN
jgi:hypothetical protein